MAFISERTARRQLESEADKVKQADIQRLLERQQAVEEKVKTSGKLDRFTTDIKLMFSLVRDYYNGRYRSIPWKSIAAIVGALIYVLNRLDLIPDLILSIGFVDDVGVVALCLKLVESDLHRYAAWKELQDTN